MKKIIVCALMALATLSASAKDQNDTLRVSTNPIMHCSGCENRIKSNIRFVKGVKGINASHKTQTVTIVYNPKKATYETFEAAFRKIGFEIKRK